MAQTVKPKKKKLKLQKMSWAEFKRRVKLAPKKNITYGAICLIGCIAMFVIFIVKLL